MSSPYLSKSDFKASFDCRTKLFFRKNKYPTNLDENEYVQFLADGGFMIEVVAKAAYPCGVDLADEHDHVRAFEKTKELIAARPDAVIFEAGALFGKYLARVDILRRDRRTLHLIEVKSSSIDPTDDEDEDEALSPFLVTRGPNKGKPTAKWKPYLLDVAFQTFVLRQAFPEYTIQPWLCVVNKAARATANETLDKFALVHDDANPKARPVITYSGDPVALGKSALMVRRDVSAEVDSLMPEVVETANTLGALIGNDGTVTRVQESIAESYKHCRKCEYRFKRDSAPTPHGFAECWGGLATVPFNVLELHRVTQIASKEMADPVPPLLTRGRASYLDLSDADLGKDGVWQKRRFLQWTYSRLGKEHIPSALKAELSAHEAAPGWPLQFLDFEACNVVLPHHAGLRPYERVAFQWSCHTLHQDGRLEHAEWLNTGRDFPNFAFAESLRRQLGDSGTIYVWSPYEKSTLERVLIQIDEWLRRNPVEALRVSALSSQAELDRLVDWIRSVLGPEDDKGKHRDSPRICDLRELALAHYFHPEMLGRTSIKVVLPAVWRHNPTLRAHPWFARYVAAGPDDTLIDPYKTLPALPLSDGSEDEESAVNDGTGAIRVYQDLIFRQDAQPQFRQNREKLLKQYCELDTAAMVMIWMHWRA